MWVVKQVIPTRRLVGSSSSQKKVKDKVDTCFLDLWVWLVVLMPPPVGVVREREHPSQFKAGLSM